MKENVDKYLENLSDKVLKEISLESPSNDFTTSVMSKIEAIARPTGVMYKPLISKTMWFLISVGLIGIVAYSVLYNPTENELLSAFDLSFLTDNKLTAAMSGMTFSKTLLYSTVLFALMFAVQVPLLRGYLDRRLNF